MDSICTYPHYGRMRIWIQEAKNLPKRSQKLQLIYKQLFRNCVFKINTENANNTNGFKRILPHKVPSLGFKIIPYYCPVLDCTVGWVNF